MPVRVSAQTDSSLFRNIDSTVVSASRRTSPLSAKAEESRIDVAGIAKLPTLMGNADPLRFVRLLPSVQTGSELDAGIHIQGCDHGHNIVSIDGAPIYGANHLLGIFSVFNPSHFKTLDYSTTAPMLGYLGGSLDMIPDRGINEVSHGEASFGPMAVQGTLRLRTGRKSALTLSGRKTFLNQMYKPYLKVDGDPFEYGFGDFNASWAMTSGRDLVYADLFLSSDAANFTSMNNNLDLAFAWWNGLAAVHWNHVAGEALLSQTVFASVSSMRLDIQHIYDSGYVPSHTRHYGYKASFALDKFKAGAGISYYDVLPQYGQSTSGYLQNLGTKEIQKALQGDLTAGWNSGLFLSHWSVDAAMKASWYFSPEKDSFWSLSPALSLKYDMFRAGILELRTGTATQNIFNTGITSLGFPIEFNILAGRHGNPQSSIYGALSYNLRFHHDSFSLSADLYCRRLRNQLEYGGTILDFLRYGQDLDAILIKADGWNYGLNLIIHKQTGKLTGWVGYSLGRSMRRSSDGEVFPSNFERIHELDAAATYSARRWDAGGTFIAASGTPFTAPEAMYITSAQILCRYGKHNGARLAPYLRLDLNFNWYFRNDTHISHGINVSLYNALARDNQLSYKYTFRDGAFAYRPYCFALKLMPGIGWFYKF